MTAQDFAKQELVFETDTLNIDTHKIYPSSSELFEYWHIYTANVDPVTKILHVPSLGRTLVEIKDNLLSLDASMQALVLSMCFAAVSSMSPGEVQTRFGETKDTRLQKLKQATENGLTRANFQQSKDTNTLQALMVYLVRRATTISKGKLIANVPCRFVEVHSTIVK